MGIGLSKSGDNDPLIDYRGVPFRAIEAIYDTLFTSRVEDKMDRLFDLRVAAKACKSGDFQFEKGETFTVRESTTEMLLVTRDYGKDDDSSLKGWVAKSDVVVKERKDWTTEDVCNGMIKMFNDSKRTSTFTQLSRHTRAKKKFDGTFVSQARGCKFKDLVDALRFYYQQKDANFNKDETFVWLDIFCVNQRKMTSKSASAEERRSRESQLTEDLHEAIKHFQDVVLFLDNWGEPYALKRAWCLWELYGVFKSGSELSIAVPVTEYMAVVEALNTGNLMETIMPINFAEARCKNPEDLEMIQKYSKDVHDEIEEGVREGLALWAAKTGVRLFDILFKLPYDDIVETPNELLDSTNHAHHLYVLLYEFVYTAPEIETLPGSEKALKYLARTAYFGIELSTLLANCGLDADSQRIYDNLVALRKKFDRHNYLGLPLHE